MVWRWESTLLRRFVAGCLFCCSLSAVAQPAQTLDDLNLTELPSILGKSAQQVLAGVSGQPTPSAGLLSEHAGFRGALGELRLQQRLAQPWDHTELLQEATLLQVLGGALTEGVITGYDLRRRDVFGEFRRGGTFVYSHGSHHHLQQLSAVLAVEGVSARVFQTPKVSAFVYREDWGSRSDHVQMLPGGIEVVNGREAATLFEFATGQDQTRFHELVQRYAKKDEADEPGLIVDAWWQPFYYTDAPFADFPSISLVVVSSATAEATLTVLPHLTAQVVAAVDQQGLQVRVDTVWVNPAFYRFLQGDYR